MSETVNPVFEVVFGCTNCGAEWEDQFPSRTVIHEDSQSVSTLNKDCSVLGTMGCDCCNVVCCPVCELTDNVSVEDRSPIEQDDE